MGLLNELREHIVGLEAERDKLRELLAGCVLECGCRNPPVHLTGDVLDAPKGCGKCSTCIAQAALAETEVE